MKQALAGLTQSTVGSRRSAHGEEYGRKKMGIVTTLTGAPRVAAFDMKKGSYMIVRGDMPPGVDPVAEVIDTEGRGFAIHEIDQGEISLSSDDTMAWITVRTHTAVHAHTFTAWARNALLRAEISVTAATGFAHEHLFVPRDKAPKAMAILRDVHDAFRMRESVFVVLLAAGRTEESPSAPMVALAQEVLDQDAGHRGNVDLMPSEAAILFQKISSGRSLSARDRMKCLLVEASIRDSVRAPAFQFEPVTEAVRAARGRGITVTLLDDRGHPLSGSQRLALTDWLVGPLAALHTGRVTARLLPVGRKALAIATISDGRTSTTFELEAIR